MLWLAVAFLLAAVFVLAWAAWWLRRETRLHDENIAALLWQIKQASARIDRLEQHPKDP